MANYESFYTGSQYPFEKAYAGFEAMGAYHPEVKNMAYPTDPLTANQLKKVSDKLNTGAKTIEVSGLGLSGAGPMKHLASIPRQHWKEIDRLRQLTGVDLTFHGPLVESTGYSRGNWTEDQRKEAETQMKAAVELAQQMNSQSAIDNPKGVVMTFHTNNGLPEVERRVKIGVNEDGSPKEEIVQMSVVNLRTGQIGTLPIFPKQDHYENKRENIKDSLKEFNDKQWNQQIESIFVNNTRIRRELVETLSSSSKLSEEVKKAKPEYQDGIFGAYKVYNDNYAQYEKDLEKIKETNPQIAHAISSSVSGLQNAEFFVDGSYKQLKELYNEAYQQAEKNKNTKAIDKLTKYRDELAPLVKRFQTDKSAMIELQDKITDGTRILKEDGVKPDLYTPLRDFAVDKGSETFSNVALQAYKNVQKTGRSPGIISIENPPAGMSGLTRADELRDLIEESRKKFVEKAMRPEEEGGFEMSKDKATEVSKQIIGATWDVGHINSIRKWGFTKADVLREAKTISPFVKHMHIADNLGFEDAELPIGMGNVPIDEILSSKEAWTENFRKAKKAIETGDWFSRQGGMGMQYTPVRESLSGLTSPVYSMGTGQSAYWNQAVNSYGSYWGGLGDINPQVHHSIYGAGFGGLPAYLGGEVPGRQNSSFSGAPLE
ncbi:MAG: hypothetical protein ACP5NS_00630 [Candidatus Pacearchaeota archaeon]